MAEVLTGIGQPVPRTEDLRLLTGRGNYSDDLSLPNQAYVYLLRSLHAHARVSRIDIEAARTAPGVCAVLTADDYKADGFGGIPYQPTPVDAVDPGKPAFVNIDGSAPFEAPQMPLVDGIVRRVGEVVVLVVGDTLAAARDAAELIEIDYDPLPTVVDALEAIQDRAPQVWDGAPNNHCVDAELGDQAAVAAAFERAAHVVEGTFVVNRVVNAQMEPRGAVADYDEISGVHTLFAGSQGVHRFKMELARTLGVAPDKVRVVTGDVGGGFGPRNFLGAEFALVVWAARRLGRPVKWTCDRSDAFIADVQARDLVNRAALALDADGNFLALHAELFSNVGGNLVSYVPLGNGPRLLTSIYTIGAAYARFRGITTNTLATGPYRGAGRPEAMFVVERLIDLAALKLGRDRTALRRRNLVTPEAMPYVSPMGVTFDSGAFARNMEIALMRADWDGFAERRETARIGGALRGIGIANFVEAPVGAPFEHAEIVVRADQKVEVVVGTQSQGQGHETTFAQVVSEWLGVPFDAVAIVTGDTDRVPIGGGSHSDRSMRLAGKVMVDACEQIIDKGRRAAAQLLEAAETDIEFASGRFTVVGTDRAIGMFDIAAALSSGDLPEAMGSSLDGVGDFKGRIPAYPNGCAVCEVEIDPETGFVQIVNYVSVDDVGRVINPLIVHGQAHGAITMGIGQTLYEDAIYDRTTGQLLSGSFMDYCLSRADNLPSFVVETNEEAPTSGNPLGVKGGGEGGTVGALAAVINAVVDALRRIWRPPYRHACNVRARLAGDPRGCSLN